MDARRLIRKQLQPARPIRRILPGTGAVFINFQATFTDCRENFKDHCNVWCAIENLDDVFKDAGMEKPLEEPQCNNKKDRITYTRDFLLQLSDVSVSKQKPKYLPDLPIVLQDPEYWHLCEVHHDRQQMALKSHKWKLEFHIDWKSPASTVPLTPFVPADMQDTHLSARPDHRSYHLSLDDTHF